MQKRLDGLARGAAIARALVRPIRIVDYWQSKVGALPRAFCVFILVKAEPYESKDDRKQTGSGNDARPNANCGGRRGDKTDHRYPGSDKSNPEDQQQVCVNPL
jgi:hypothetical protein